MGWKRILQGCFDPFHVTKNTRARCKKQHSPKENRKTCRSLWIVDDICVSIDVTPHWKRWVLRRRRGSACRATPSVPHIFRMGSAWNGDMQSFAGFTGLVPSPSRRGRWGEGLHVECSKWNWPIHAQPSLIDQLAPTWNHHTSIRVNYLFLNQPNHNPDGWNVGKWANAWQMPQYEFSDNKDSTYIFFGLAYAEAIPSDSWWWCCWWSLLSWCIYIYYIYSSH